MASLLSNRLGLPLFLTQVFHLKELHMLNRGHRNGLSSCRFGCTLGGFGTRFGSFGGRFGSGLAAGSSPCGEQFASRTWRVKYNFPLAKTLAKPDTPQALFAHIISVPNAL